MLKVIVDYNDVLFGEFWVSAHEGCDCLPWKVHKRFRETDDKIRKCQEAVLVIFAVFCWGVLVSFQQVVGDKEAADVVTRP